MYYSLTLLTALTDHATTYSYTKFFIFENCTVLLLITGFWLYIAFCKLEDWIDEKMWVLKEVSVCVRERERMKELQTLNGVFVVMMVPLLLREERKKERVSQMLGPCMAQKAAMRTKFCWNFWNYHVGYLSTCHPHSWCKFFFTIQCIYSFFLMILTKFILFKNVRLEYYNNNLIFENGCHDIGLINKYC